MTHINQRRDLAATWATANPVLQLGEVGWETDTRKAKLGDGVTAWNSLSYAVIPVDLSLYATKASPTFTGNPKAPTPSTGDDDTSIATTEFVKNVLEESPTLGGFPTATTPPVGDDDDSIATTNWVRQQGYSTLDTPIFTGNPQAPTPVTSDNDTSVATTAFVKAAITAGIPSSSSPVTDGIFTDAAGTTAHKRGNLVVVSVNLTVIGMGGLHSGDALFTLPSGYIPPSTIFATLIAIFSGTSPVVYAYASNDGVVTIDATVPSGGVIRGEIVLPV